MALDCVLLLALGLAGQSAAFTSKMGRAIVCVDSYQYIATAEALLDPELTPHFEMRKPGYPLFLAAVQLLTGRLGWTAVVANHLLFATLPLAAYGFGVHLRSRGLVAKPSKVASRSTSQSQTCVPAIAIMRERSMRLSPVITPSLTC